MFEKNSLHLTKNKSSFKDDLLKSFTGVIMNLHPDILILQHTLEKEEINTQLKEFNIYKPIKLDHKVVVVENVDFYSISQQEVFLKYIENSKLNFYFSASDVFRIKSQALLSRLQIKDYASKPLKDFIDIKILEIYSYILKEEVYTLKSESEMVIKYRLKPNLQKLETDFISGLDLLVKIFKDLEKEYPIWYILGIIYNDLFSGNDSIDIVLRNIKLEDLDDLVNFLHIRYWASNLLKKS